MYNLYNDGLTYAFDPAIANSFAASTGVYIWTIIAAILAVIGGVLAYFLFVKSKDDPKNKFLKWLKNFLAFKVMWIEPMTKIFYYIGTIFCILFSFTFIGADFVAFIVTLICGPIVIRLFYEGMIMLIMIWRNTQDISDNTKKK